jgi:hypothetical protein
MDKKCIPYGSDVSGGTFKCQDCGKIMKMASSTSLPPCSNFNKTSHLKKCWQNLTGLGDSPDDPYPKK